MPTPPTPSGSRSTSAPGGCGAPSPCSTACATVIPSASCSGAGSSANSARRAPVLVGPPGARPIHRAVAAPVPTRRHHRYRASWATPPPTRRPRWSCTGCGSATPTGSGTIPFGDQDLPGFGTPEHTATKALLDRLDDDVDAVADILLAEGVYQATRWTYLQRAVESLDAAAGVGASAEARVRHHASRLGRRRRTDSQWSPCRGPTRVPVLSSTPRAQAEPALNAWLGHVLGDPRDIRCRVAVDASGTLPPTRRRCRSLISGSHHSTSCSSTASSAPPRVPATSPNVSWTPRPRVTPRPAGRHCCSLRDPGLAARGAVRRRGRRARPPAACARDRCRCHLRRRTSSCPRSPTP